MNWIPNWYALALLSLASWRTFQLLAWDDIADPLRRRVTRLGNDWNEPGDPVPDDYRYSWAKFIECPYCFGFWISVSWYFAWLIAGDGGSRPVGPAGDLDGADRDRGADRQGVAPGTSACLI